MQTDGRVDEFFVDPNLPGLHIQRWHLSSHVGMQMNFENIRGFSDIEQIAAEEDRLAKAMSKTSKNKRDVGFRKS
jgi:hypothetical protein